MAYKDDDERDDILKPLEEHNIALTKAFEKYREIKNIKFPKTDEDGKVDPEDEDILVKIYWGHRAPLKL